MESSSLKTQELKLAEDFVQNTGKHIFLTGKAGTGKTTFLHNLKDKTAKRLIITAPTGVAAINAGGVTLHSFFQLSFGPFIPGSENQEKNRQRLFRFSKDKLRIIKSLDLLVIDEISMVRADLLDYVDAVLRRLRRNDKPFGGVQLLMIGDLFQLPPVAKPHEWEILEQYYSSPYFFSSRALCRAAFTTIELTRVFRQDDARFIKILNQVRDNQLDASAIDELNRRYVKHYVPEESQGYITLTTHNRSADTLNESRLSLLTGKEYRLDASVSGEFPDQLFPTPKNLVFKPGAQVMFLRNDPSGENRYYNGKIGRIKSISQDEIRVVCPNESGEIAVEPVQWDNIKYTVNEENKEIQEEVIGTFTQFPLKLAWAITIHKSQGLTFDKAVIDAKAAFAQGQVYVALSRCKTLEGMVLSSPVPQRGIQADNAVLDFVQSARQEPPSWDRLKADQISYQQKLLLECFDFTILRSRFNYLIRLAMGNASRVKVLGVPDLENLQAMITKDMFDVSEKFAKQLHFLFENQNLPENDAHIQNRIGKASGWFQEKLSILMDDFVRTFSIETDNQEIRKQLDNALNNLKQEIAVKIAGVCSCENGFSPEDYLRAVSKAGIDEKPEKVKKPKPPDYAETDIKYPALLQRLKDWRAATAKEKEVSPFQIVHQQVLIQIAVSLPDTREKLKKIKGVGKKTLENYGEELLAMVAAYRKTKGRDGAISSK